MVQIGGLDASLAVYYRCAELFDCPSFCGEFRVPSGAEVALGRRVEGSNTNSFSEVTDDGAACFDPRDWKQIRFVLEGVPTSSSAQRVLVERGFARSRTFPWRRCADATAAICSSVRAR